jgi:hypothetical protein
MYKSAFFISPNGKIITVGTSHIAEVIKNPEIFGLKLENIKEIYRKHNEPLGLEGKARREILIQIIQQGWIRLRRYRESWSVTVYRFSPETKHQLQNWAANINDDDSFIPVKINELATNQEHHFHFSLFFSPFLSSIIS